MRDRRPEPPDDPARNASEHQARSHTLLGGRLDGPLTTYDIDIYRDEAGYWIADVPSVPGAHTFAKRIDQITVNIREAIAVALDIDDIDATRDQPEGRARVIAREAAWRGAASSRRRR